MNKRILITLAAFLATLCSSQLRATDYYWVGGDSGNWSETNWSTDSTATTADVAGSDISSEDTVIFNNDVTVTIDEDKKGCNSLKANAAVTLTASTKTIVFQNSGTIGGSGSLSLTGGVILRAANGTTTVSLPITLSGSNQFLATAGSNAGSLYFTGTGTVSGSGTLNLNTTYGSSGSSAGHIEFAAGLSGFSGNIITTRASSYVNVNKFYYVFGSDAADCSDATLDYFFSSASDYVPTSSDCFPFTAGTEYKFGSLFATIPSCGSGTYTLTIGADKTTSSSLAGSWGSATGNITFASTGTLTNDCANTASITVSNGGTVCFPSSSGVPKTLNFSADNGTVLVPYDTETLSAVTTALGSSTYSPTIKYYGTMEVSAGEDIGSYAVADGVTVKITLASNTASGDTLLTYSGADFSSATITLVSPNTGSASVFFDADTSTSGCIKAKYKEGVCVWDGEEDAEFGTASNWKVVASDGTYESAASALSTSTVLAFPESASVKVGKANCGSILLLADVTFKASSSGITSSYLNFGNGSIVEGSGTFIANGLAGFRNLGIAATFYSDMELQADTIFTISTGTGTYYIYGKLIAASGITATIQDKYSNSASGTMKVVIAGDMSEYNGNITTSFSNSDSSYLQFTGAATNLVNATVTLGSTGNATALCGSAGTYTFGSLSGKVTGGSEAVTIVTGSADSTDDTEIAYTAGSADWALWKVGKKTLTITNGDFASYILDGGKLATVEAQTIDGDDATITTTIDRRYIVDNGGNVYSLATRGFAVIIR